MNEQQMNAAMLNVPFRSDDFHGMPYRYMGRSGLRVSSVGLGTWKIGDPETGDGSRVAREAALRIFDRAIELGVTHWDTANRYHNASGNSERIIGEWFRRHPEQRRNVVVATKIYGGMDGYSPNHSGLSRGSILDAVYASLKRLGLEYIDLLYFHGFDANVPAEESLMAIEDLVRRDLVRYFGVSNFTVDQLATYRAAQASLSGRCRVQAVQNQYNLVQGEVTEQGVLAQAVREGYAYVPWSPLARGLLTGRYLDRQQAAPGDRLYDEGAEVGEPPHEIWQQIRELAELARQWELELSQLVIAYMLAMPGMGPIIAAASTVGQLESNARAGTIKLTDNQRLRIKAILERPSTGGYK